MPHETDRRLGPQGHLPSQASTMLRRLLLGHKKFIFVPSEISDDGSRHHRERASVRCSTPCCATPRTSSRVTSSAAATSGRTIRRSGLYQAVRSFQEDVGSKVVLAVYRASHARPGRVFYAHEDHVHEAAQIVMADSALQEAGASPT